MQEIINFLNKFEVWFFYGLLITFTFSIRKVLFFYPIRNQFNEYAGIYLYLSDIFLFLMLVSGGFLILCNIISLKSRYLVNILPYLKQKVIILPLLLVVLSFFSIFWSENKNIAIFRSIKLFEFYLLYLWIVFTVILPAEQYFVSKAMFHACLTESHVKHKENEKCSTWNIFRNSVLIIIIIGIIQSIIAICQFTIQKSIGLTWIKESIISPDISGVAKIILGGEKYIRAYGLFPHPNILAGFLVFSIILTGAYFKMFHVKHKENEKCSTWNICIYYIVLIIQGVAIFLTFSKSAWVGLFFSILYLCYRNDESFLIKEEYGMFFKKRIKNLFHLLYRQASAEKIKRILITAVVIILLVFVLNPNWKSFLGKSIEDRMFYLNVSRETFLKNPILGNGSGQFVFNMENIKNIQDWQFQPVHNVFLLILNELGILGLILFVFFIWKIMKNVPRGTFYNYSNGILISFLFIMLFDHYFWDIQQGQIMVWVLLAILAGGNLWINKKFALSIK